MSEMGTWSSVALPRDDTTRGGGSNPTTTTPNDTDGKTSKTINACIDREINEDEYDIK